MKSTGKILAVLLAAVLLLAGCAGGDVSWVFKSGDLSIPPGLYIIYQIRAFADAEEMIAQEHASDVDFTPPSTSEVLKMTVEGQPASDWINAKAREKTYRHIVARQKFQEMGLSFTETDLSSIESNVGSMKSQSADFYQKNGISDASIREYYTGVVRENTLFAALYGEGGEYTVAKEELLEYFGSNYALIDAIPMYKPYTAPEDGTKTIEDLQQEIKVDAEDYVKRLSAGEEIEALMYEWQLKSAEDGEKDSVKKTEKGSLRLVLSDSSRTGYGDVLVDAAFAAKVGEPQIAEDEYFFAVFNRVDPATDSDSFDTYKSLLLYELKNEDYFKKLDEWAAAAAIEENTAALNRYNPGRLKLETAQ